MKKYKLIKHYPGSPNCELGTIFEYHSQTGNYFAEEGWYIHSRFVVNQPEFWEEVEEKNYEILSIFANTDINAIDKNTVVSNRNNKYFVNESEGISFPYNRFFTNSNWSIHSIKRLSDGEVFTVGDKVEHGYLCCGEEKRLKWNINSISIENNRLKLFSGTGFYREIGEIVKQKQPVFTTEDGVGIYQGDKYFFVGIGDLINSNIVHDAESWHRNNDINEFKRFSTKKGAREYIDSQKVLFISEDGVEMTKGDIYWVPQAGYDEACMFKASSTKDYKKDDSKRFSTEESAQKYIDENKVKYSKKDIKEALKDSLFHIASNCQVVDVTRVKNKLDI